MLISVLGVSEQDQVIVNPQPLAFSRIRTLRIAEGCTAIVVGLQRRNTGINVIQEVTLERNVIDDSDVAALAGARSENNRCPGRRAHPGVLHNISGDHYSPRALEFQVVLLNPLIISPHRTGAPIRQLLPGWHGSASAAGFPG